MTLGEFISQYRADHDNMSIRSFASMVGMSPQQISNIEKGIGNNKKTMSSTMNTYKKIAKGIGMSEQDFLNLLNDNVLVNPSYYPDEYIKNLPISYVDGQMVLNLSDISDEQRQAIFLVLQSGPEALHSALRSVESSISLRPSQDTAQ